MTRIKSRPRVTPCGWSIHARGRDLIDQLKDMSIGLWSASFAANQANIAALYRCGDRDAVNLWNRLERSGYVDVHDGVMRLGDSGRRLMNARYPEPQVETLVRLTNHASRESTSNASRAEYFATADQFAGAVGEKRITVLSLIVEQPGLSTSEIGAILAPSSNDPHKALSPQIARLAMLGLIEAEMRAEPRTSRQRIFYFPTQEGRDKLASLRPTPSATPPNLPVTIRGTTYPTRAAAAEGENVSISAIDIAVKRGKLDLVGTGGRAERVRIRGEEYPTQKAAARAWCVSPRTIRKAIKLGTLDDIGIAKVKEAAE